MSKQAIKDTLGWGIALWLIGYVLGIIFFMWMPVNLIGWVVMPIGILITVWVLMKRIKGDSMKYYLQVAIAWTVIAVVFDYILLVKLFKPADGYYKLDVYLYYLLTMLLPLAAGWYKNRKAIYRG